MQTRIPHLLMVLSFLTLGLVAQPQVVNIGGGPIFDGSGGPLSGIIHASGTWNVPVGETLTILPGTKIKFEGGIQARIVVDGSLVVQGTEQLKVFISSRKDDEAGGNTNNSGALPAPGDWNGIQVSNGSSVFIQHANIRFGRELIRMVGTGSLDLRDSEVASALFSGINCNNTGTIALTNVDFHDNLEIPLEDVPIDQVPNFGGLTASNNGDGEIISVRVENLATTVAVSPDNTFDQTGVLCCLFGHSPTVAAGGELILGAGTVFKGANSGFIINGTLTCNGTEADPVVFTSLLDDTIGGDTNGDGAASTPATVPGFRLRALELRSGSDASVLRHVLYREVGAGTAAIQITSSSPMIENCRIENVFGNRDGVRMNQNSLPTIRGLHVENAGDEAVTGVSIQALPNFEDITAANCLGGDFLRVDTGSLSGFGHVVITPRNYPGEVLVIARSYDLSSGDRIEMRDGVIVKFDGAREIDAGDGALDLLGTAVRPVIMTNLADDSIAGDTLKDGPTSGGFWSRIRLQTSSQASTIEHVLLRNYSGTSRFESALCTVRSLRAEPRGNAAAVSFRNLVNPVDNLVVFFSSTNSGDGVLLNSGNYDLRHATIFGAGDDGIFAFSSYSGSVRNSIVFGNGGDNIQGVPDTRVFDTIGVFDGINGNLEVDPLFVDPLNGDLTLQATSPAVDTADLNTALSVIADHVEHSRALPSVPGGVWAADRGAFELAPHTLAFTGTGELGTNIAFDAQGPAIDSVLYFIGGTFVPFFAPPLGISLVGEPQDLLLFGPFVAPNTSLPFILPTDPIFEGFTIGCQGLVQTSLPAPALSLTNRVRVRFF